MSMGATPLDSKGYKEMEVVSVTTDTTSYHISCVWLFVTPWTVASQAPLSMGFSRQEYTQARWHLELTITPTLQWGPQSLWHPLWVSPSIWLWNISPAPGVPSPTAQASVLSSTPAHIPAWVFLILPPLCFLLQWVFPTLGSNPHLFCLLHWQAGSWPQCHLGGSYYISWSKSEHGL